MQNKRPHQPIRAQVTRKLKSRLRIPIADWKVRRSDVATSQRGPTLTAIERWIIGKQSKQQKSHSFVSNNNNIHPDRSCTNIVRQYRNDRKRYSRACRLSILIGQQQNKTNMCANKTHAPEITAKNLPILHMIVDARFLSNPIGVEEAIKSKPGKQERKKHGSY